MNTLSYPKLADRVRSYICDNGLRVYVLPRHDIKTVTVQAWVATGCVHEQQYAGSGLSHFLEHMSFQGTKQYPKTQIADHIALLGGQVNAATSAEYTYYYITLPSANAEDAVNMLDSMLREPLFESDQFQSEREVILRELAMYKDSPVQNLFDKLREETFRRHPLRYPVGGYPEKLKLLTPEMMREYHDRRYTPGRTSYVIVGDVDPDTIFEMIRKKTADWQRGNLEEPYLPQEQMCFTQRCLRTTFAAPQAYSAVAWQTPGSMKRDSLAADVFADILGNGDSSRLYEELVKRKHLALDLIFYSNALSEVGYSSIVTMSEPDKTEKLTGEIFAILQEFLEGGPTDEEMERTRNCYRAEYLRRLQTNDGLATILGQNIISGGDPSSTDDFLERLNRLTKEDIVAVGRKYFQSKSATVIEQFPDGYKKISAAKSKDVPHAQIPFMTELAEGQRLIYLENRSLPLVDMTLLLPGGVTLERPAKAGLTRLLAEVLPAGNSKYSESEFNHLLDLHAVDLSVMSGRTALQFQLNVPKEHFSFMIDMFISMLREPLFDPAVIERERIALIEELKHNQMTPLSVADSQMRKEMFAGHPLGIGNAEMLKTIPHITRNDLMEFYREITLNIHKMVIGFSGDLSQKEALSAAKKIRKAIPWNKKKLPCVPAPVFPEKTIRVSSSLPREQAIVMLAMPGVDIASPDRTILDLVHADASSMASRLFNATRNENGLVYYTGFTHADGYGYPGCMGYYGGTAAAGVKKLEKIFKDEIRYRIEKGFSGQEFENARRLRLFQMDTLHQASDDLLLMLCSLEFTGAGWQEFEMSSKRILSMNRSEFNRQLKRIYKDRIMVCSMVLPEKKDI